MVYQECKPIVPLSPYIECFWVVQSQDKPPFQPMEILIPDGTIELILNYGSSYKRFTDFTRHAHICLLLSQPGKAWI